MPKFITFTGVVRWNTHASNICTNLTELLICLDETYIPRCKRGSLQRIDAPIPLVLEFGSSVWDRQGVVLQGGIIKRAVRFVKLGLSQNPICIHLPYMAKI